MKVFIVYGHREPKSFNGALTEAAIAALTANGHETCVSDLCAMWFDPVSDRRNFTTTGDGDYLKQQGEEAHATGRHMVGSQRILRRNSKSSIGAMY